VQRRSKEEKFDCREEGRPPSFIYSQHGLNKKELDGARSTLAVADPSTNWATHDALVKQTYPGRTIWAMASLLLIVMEAYLVILPGTMQD